jgi:hypothetical protein
VRSVYRSRSCKASRAGQGVPGHALERALGNASGFPLVQGFSLTLGLGEFLVDRFQSFGAFERVSLPSLGGCGDVAFDPLQVANYVAQTHFPR